MALKDLNSLLFPIHFRRSYLMKSAWECSLDSQMYLARSQRLNLPIEHMQSRVRPREQTSSLKGSKYFYLGTRQFFRNQGELYQTVVSSATLRSRPSISITSSKSHRRQLPLLQRIFQGLMSRWARFSRCSLSKTESIWPRKLFIYQRLKGWFFFLRSITYPWRFISYFYMNCSRETCYLEEDEVGVGLSEVGVGVGGLLVVAEPGASLRMRCPSFQPVLVR